MALLKVPYPTPIDFTKWVVIDNIPSMKPSYLWWLLDISDIGIVDKRMVQSAVQDTNESAVLIYSSVADANRAFISFQLKLRGTPFLALKASDYLSYVAEYERCSKRLKMGSDTAGCQVHYRLDKDDKFIQYRHLFYLFGPIEKWVDGEAGNTGRVFYKQREDAIAAVWGLDKQTFDDITLTAWRSYRATMPFPQLTLLVILRRLGWLPYHDGNYEQWLKKNGHDKFPPVSKLAPSKEMLLGDEEKFALSLCNFLAAPVDCPDKHCPMNVAHAACTPERCFITHAPCYRQTAPFDKVCKLLKDAIESVTTQQPFTGKPLRARPSLPETRRSEIFSYDVVTKKLRIPELKITSDEGKETKLSRGLLLDHIDGKPIRRATNVDDMDLVDVEMGPFSGGYELTEEDCLKLEALVAEDGPEPLILPQAQFDLETPRASLLAGLEHVSDILVKKILAGEEITELSSPVHKSHSVAKTELVQEGSREKMDCGQVKPEIERAKAVSIDLNAEQLKKSKEIAIEPVLVNPMETSLEQDLSMKSLEPSSEENGSESVVLGAQEASQRKELAGESLQPSSEENGSTPVVAAEASPRKELAGESLQPSSEEIGSAPVAAAEASPRKQLAEESLQPSSEENGSTPVVAAEASPRKELAEESLQPSSEENGSELVVVGAKETSPRKDLSEK